MKSLYDILGADRGADLREIKRAYFVMAKKFHPDSGDSAEVARFYEVTQAYKTLSDKEKRRAYDLSMEDGAIKSAEPAKPEAKPFFRQEPMTAKEVEFRRKEMEEYRRRLFIQAILKVIIAVLIGAVAGNTLVVILGGSYIIGIIAGAVFAFLWAVSNGFDLATFFESRKQRLMALWGSRLLMALSVFYFAGLFLYHLLRAA